VDNDLRGDATLEGVVWDVARRPAVSGSAIFSPQYPTQTSAVIESTVSKSTSGYMSVKSEEEVTVPEEHAPSPLSNSANNGWGR